ncbi:L,D-transpeptidase family protein [Roseivivax sp. GX 12232]|uniref:L,D-transpeptidase family protein n=1 Tax=Roseivivax sp. GX 12232 TaxID=2900547 RepID=UPI001E4A833D|nr:L,D-transpeptidase family protein [Roseivivax sp. GX 12232]MCE0506340.1 L,D-transpeptidase family protein [Roseivivax sp. GX 12232]
MALGLSACSSKFKTYNGPEVTQVVVDKSDRKMYLLHHREVLKSYRIGLGFAPEGDKQIEGDGKTPEGLYFIDRRNPNSRFHLSIGISYPNEADIAEAIALGKSPGGDIFIHGGPPKGARFSPRSDWTWGCIAVKDREMEDVYAMVRDGTPILIQP